MDCRAPSLVMPGWRFFIDRGGTFTDIVAIGPGRNVVTLKLPSNDPESPELSELTAIRSILGPNSASEIPEGCIEEVRIGTTVGTNALLERKGGPVALLTTRGFGDAFQIGYQNRPSLFEKAIRLPEPLYTHALEVSERTAASGEPLLPLDVEAVRTLLRALKAKGSSSLAVVLMHSWRAPEKEKILAKLAKELGFEHVTASHETAPIGKLIVRGETALLEAYLAPVLKRYTERLEGELRGAALYWMQSSGGLARQGAFQAKDSVLSGPAAGLVGAAALAKAAGYERIITFDMGGTSTDVAVFDGAFSRALESTLGGARVSIPMLQIHTIAAGGGSVLRFEANRFLVGPQSAGANPGPSCYGVQGPLAVTDCNVILGRIAPTFFPKVFGEQRNAALNPEAPRRLFGELGALLEQATGRKWSIEELADGYLTIAAQNMADAIAEVTLKKGLDPKSFLLFGFGGAAGQVILRVADILEIPQVLLSPFSGVLSALGLGLADISKSLRRSLQEVLAPGLWPKLEETFLAMEREAEERLGVDGHAACKIVRKMGLRYEGTDTVIEVPFGGASELEEAFIAEHRRMFGFVYEGRALVVDSLFLERQEGFGLHDALLKAPSNRPTSPSLLGQTKIFLGDGFKEVPVYALESLPESFLIDGPAMLLSPSQTWIVEEGWRGKVDPLGNMFLLRQGSRPKRPKASAKDPFQVELFGNRLMNIAETMGVVLQKTASSVNIKERLDFSCALFDAKGDLLANAPHLPVHLGSMDMAIKGLIRLKGSSLKDGEVYIVNTPSLGGTHLPDLTVISPVFYEGSKKPVGFVASRGHHADIGGVTPGSMPAFSRTLQEEGIPFRGETIVQAGRFLEKDLLDILCRPPFPARSPETNLLDIKAQLAANARGIEEMKRLLLQVGRRGFQALALALRAKARSAVLDAITLLPKGRMRLLMDDRRPLCVALDPNPAKGLVRVDFTGTAPRHPGNWNAPPAVVRASVLYAFRLFLGSAIPLNAGCLDPVEILIPQGSFLDPLEETAVAAGNVEISQLIVDGLLGAMGAMAASQGTMNNITFGDKDYQYYETLGGGAGAGPWFEGASAVHTHMTNSRLTDPEVLERRFPVRILETSIRKESGGMGAFRGGDGMVRSIAFLKPCSVSLITGRRLVPPFGLQGGLEGQPGENMIIKTDGSVAALPPVTEFKVEPGDILTIKTPGGGGFGQVSKVSSSNGDPS